MKRFLSLTLLALLIGSFPWGCGKIGKKGTPGPKDKVYSVSAIKPALQDVPDLLEFKGLFIPLQSLEVKSDFTGKVQALSVVDGQSVLSGDVLLKIEDEKLPWVLERQRAELREAEAQFDLDTRLGPEYEGEEVAEEAEEEAEVEQEEQTEQGEQAQAQSEGETPEATEEEGQEDPAARFRRLAQLRRRARQAREAARQQTNASPRPIQTEENGEVIESRQTLNQAKIDRIKAEVALTEKQLGGSTLVTPIDGFISDVKVSEGTLVKPDALIMEIITIDPIDLSLMVPKDKINRVDKSMEVEVSLPDLGDPTFPGSISFIGAELEPNKKEVEVRVRLDNRELKIKAGMEGIARMALAKSSRQALMIPAGAVVVRDGNPFVYRIQGQVAELQAIEKGAVVGEMVEVKRGVRSSDPLVLQGIGQLKEEEEFVRLPTNP